MNKLRIGFFTIRLLPLLFVTTLFVNTAVYSNDGMSIESLSGLTLDQLLNIKIESATKKPDKISDIPASVYIVTREDISTYGYQSLEEILENVPGFYNIDDYNDGAKFGIRGFWNGMENDGLILLVNGVNYEYHYISATSMAQFYIPVESIDRIEIIRGPMSVTYGQGAFYGIINITTNEVLEENQNQVYVSYGSLNATTMTAISSGSAHELAYRINVSSFYTSGLEYDYSELTSNPQLRSESLKDKMERNSKSFNSTVNYKDFKFEISFYQNDQEIYFSFVPAGEGNLAAHQFFAASGEYEKEYFKKFDIKASVNYSDQNRYMDYELIFQDFMGSQTQRSKCVDAELNINHKINSELNVSYNIQYRSIFEVMSAFDLPSIGVHGMENNIVQLEDDSNIDTYAASVQLSWKPIKKLIFTAGGRVESMLPYSMFSQHVHFDSVMVNNLISAEYDYSDIDFIPRAALVYHFNDNNSLKFLYGKAINRPSFFQNTKNTLDPNASQLQPERIETFECNYLGVLTHWMMINASAYYNQLDNLVTRIIEYDQNGNYFTWNKNAGRLETIGTELTLRIEAFRNFKINISGILQQNDEQTPGLDDMTPAYSPELLGYAKLNYTYSDYIFGLACTYVGEMEPYFDNRPSSQGGSSLIGRIADKSPSYATIGLNIRKNKIFNDNIFATLKISNIFDTEIRYPVFNNNTWMDKGTLGYGRRIFIGAGIRF